MLYQIESEERTAGGRSGKVYTLSHSGGEARAEIWPDHGFNCLRWQVRCGDRLCDALYADPQWQENPVPTRSGVPILFPFPNRIRDGRYQFGGREVQLPCNDPARKNAIHGFTPRRPWRVVGQGVEHDQAWLQGQFQASLDAPDTLALWPSDYRLTTVIRLRESALRYEFRVENVGKEPLPFGLGMHPYFRFPQAKPDADIGGCRLRAPAAAVWVLEENLPTGLREPVAGSLDWNEQRLVGNTVLDTLYTRPWTTTSPDDDLVCRAELRHADASGALQVWADEAFRELVLFTPPHRQALCIEPYTCATDAMHLDAQGIDAGWRVLEPGGEWSAVVEFRWAAHD
jgi:aldose 1-epimerase